jgi:uncharacterized protein (TIGR02611 family)
VYRIAFAVAGFLVLALGVALIPLPGPGLLVIAVGLTMLALEFAWAERLLERTVDRLESAKDAAEKATPVQKTLGVLVLLGAGVGATVAAVIWGVPFLPV